MEELKRFYKAVEEDTHEVRFVLNKLYLDVTSAFLDKPGDITLKVTFQRILSKMEIVPETSPTLIALINGVKENPDRLEELERDAINWFQEFPDHYEVDADAGKRLVATIKDIEAFRAGSQAAR